ncbi:MAG TPA: YHYH protein [Kofleriaceae bacterium]|nr:YHYH protein [Kofleriaceae bacterium]
MGTSAAGRWTLIPALAAGLLGCGDNAGDAADTTQAVHATAWSPTITISYGDGSFRFQSNGIPDHALEAEYIMPDDLTPCVPHPTADCSHVEPRETAIQPNSLDYTIPMAPRLVGDTFSLPFGPMGVLISGAPVYNPYEGDGTTVAMNANFTLLDAQGHPVAFMDTCNGHPSPHPAEQYHYHGLPGCVTARVDQANGPSHIIGFAFDGFPVYGDRDADGRPVDPAALDECNGIDSPTPEFPAGIYHYVMLDVATRQSTIRCLHGHLDLPLPHL